MLHSKTFSHLKLGDNFRLDLEGNVCINKDFMGSSASENEEALQNCGNFYAFQEANERRIEKLKDEFREDVKNQEIIISRLEGKINELSASFKNLDERDKKNVKQIDDMAKKIDTIVDILTRKLSI
jgi:hypothetical protein